MTCRCGFRACPGLKAEIRRTGRRSWTLHITDGPSIIGDPMWGSPRAFGSRKHAERKARKIMAKLAAQHDQERYVVPEPADGEDAPC